MTAGYKQSCDGAHEGPFKRVELTAENPYGVEEVYGVMARCDSCGWGMHVDVMETA